MSGVAPVYFVTSDASGNVTGYCYVDPSVAATHQARFPAQTELAATEAAKFIAGPGPWTIANGVLTAATVPFTTLQAAAKVRVDRTAESVRSKWLTQGPGMAQEYIYTEIDAMAANAAADPLTEANYPWVLAEMNAQIAAGATVTMRQVVNDIVGKIAAWKTAGMAIKQARRTAKLKIEAATTQAEIDAAIAAITWPTKS